MVHNRGMTNTRSQSLFPPSRISVSLLFLLNGFFLGNWAPKIPLLIERLAISETTMGLLIFILGLGGLSILPVTGTAMQRVGSYRMCRVFCLAVCFCLPLISLSPTVVTVAISLFFTGMVLIGLDIAMNANVLVAEKATGKMFMSSCHGWWSIGGIAGGLSGGLVLQWLGDMGHSLLVCALSALILFYAWPRLQVDGLVKTSEHTAPGKFRLVRQPSIYWLGFLGFLSVLPEGAVIDWGALYFIEELGGATVTAGYAFASLSFSMAIIRLSGDLLRTRFGSRKVTQTSCLFGATGMIISGVADSVPLAMTGFVIAGIGIANLIPIIMSAAGKQPGVEAGMGISTVGFMIMTGLMTAPAIIGYVAKFMSFSTIFSLMALAFVLILFRTSTMESADN